MEIISDQNKQARMSIEYGWREATCIIHHGGEEKGWGLLGGEKGGDDDDQNGVDDYDGDHNAWNYYTV